MNPLTPYLGWMKLAGLGLCVAAVLGFGFWTGFKWQAGNVAEAKAEQAKAETARDRYKANAEGYAGAIAAQKAASDAAVKAAAEQQRKADKAIADAKAERDKYEKKLAQIAAGIEKDKLDPKCKAELERPVCGASWR